MNDDDVIRFGLYLSTRMSDFYKHAVEGRSYRCVLEMCVHFIFFKGCSVGSNIPNHFHRAGTGKGRLSETQDSLE